LRPYSVVGLFKDSLDADVVAAYLREEFALEANEIDVIGDTHPDRVPRPAPGAPEEWVLTAFTGIGINGNIGEEDPVYKRWGDKLLNGDVLVVARVNDPDLADAVTREMRVNGAERVDLLGPLQ
jgi:hypothetical protein